MGIAVVRICTICARGGSKGLPGKNLADLCGKRLIADTIEHAIGAEVFDAIVASSDCIAILDVARAYGATHTILRPSHLASDSASKLPSIVHALEKTEARVGRADTVVELDATFPLRNIDDIHAVLDLLTTSDASSVITGTPSHRSPYFNMVEEDTNGNVNLVIDTGGNVGRRQDAPLTYGLNASIYAWKRNSLISDPRVFYPDSRLYSMPPERSLDIDSPLDFQIAEFLLKSPNNARPHGQPS